MKTLTKLFIGLTTLVGVVSPITVMTSCSKSPDQPTENVRFDVNHSEMTSSTIGTIVLGWTPNDHSLEFSSANFKYESGTKLASVLPAAESRPQTFNLTFTSALTDNITDGKLSFHCKDKTLQREYDTSVDNIRLDKYQATILTGGSTSLSGTESTAGIDTKAWALKKGETIISSTMEIVGNNVPAWITISNTEGSDNYHKVTWDDKAEAGSYTFKVKATPINSNASVESSDITLTIDSTQAPILTGGSVSLKGMATNEGVDTNAWVLKKGAQKITEGVTMSIVPISPVGDQFPTWISINDNEGSANYHKVEWTINPVEGIYKFKIKAVTTDISIESAEITLTINASPITPSGFPEGEVDRVTKDVDRIVGSNMSLKYNDGSTTIELLNEEHFSNLTFTFKDQNGDEINWIQVSPIQEETISYVVIIRAPDYGSFTISGQAKYNGIKCNLPSFYFDVNS